MYAYDFGDDCQHVLVHEGFESADDDRNYPLCVAGEGVDARERLCVNGNMQAKSGSFHRPQVRKPCHA
jgi:hypothetical protein